jgi:hypothetical protein
MQGSRFSKIGAVQWPHSQSEKGTFFPKRQVWISQFFEANIHQLKKYKNNKYDPTINLKNDSETKQFAHVIIRDSNDR